MNDKEIMSFWFIVDTSGSMYGQPIASVRNVIEECVNELKTIQNSGLYDVEIGIVAFNEDFEVLTKREAIYTFKGLSSIKVNSDADGFYRLTKYSCLYKNFPVLLEREYEGTFCKANIYAYLITDGKPDDEEDYENYIEQARQMQRFKKTHRYVALTGDAVKQIIERKSAVLPFVDGKGTRVTLVDRLPEAFSQIRMDVEQRIGFPEIDESQFVDVFK